MYALPSSDALKKACELSSSSGKSFCYVTPRLADGPLEKVREQLTFINRFGEATVVVNDLGTLHMMKRFPKLSVQLGRQLVYTPSRSPWREITERSLGFLAKRNIAKIFYQTALNYGPTIEFFKNLGVVGTDFDWIPACFDNLDFLKKNGLRISIHLHSVPAAITRKCHMGRFLGETNLDKCSKPCYLKAYSMQNTFLNTPLFLHGNAVFRLSEPEKGDVSRLKKNGVSEFVLTMGPLSRVVSHTKIDSMVQALQN